MSEPLRDAAQLNVHLDFALPPGELAQWTPREIHQFFLGIAMVQEAVRTARARLSGAEVPR